MTASPSAARLRSRLEERVGARLGLLFLAVGLAASLFAVITFVLRPPAALVPVGAADSALALGCFAAWWRVQRGRRFAHPTVAALVTLLATLGASLLAIKTLHLPQETTNVLLVEIAAAIVLLDIRAMTLVILASWIGWGLVAWSEGIDAAWLNGGFALATGSIVAAVICTARIRASKDAIAARDQLEAHARDLEQANAALRDFSHVVSHDLRNPVRGLSALASELEESAAPKLSADERGTIAMMRTTAARLSRLLESLLDYSHVTQFDATQLVPLDLRDALAGEACRARYETLVKERGASLDPPPPGIVVRANENALALILGNLVANAIAHNPSPAPQVRVRAQPASDGRVAIVVEDNGAGFDAPSLRRFEASHPQSAGRSGFGLLIVRRAAQKLGGEVRIGRSDLGGAAVSVILPAR